MLQSDFFDKETEALIDLNVIYGAGKHITDKCMIIFSKEIHTYLVSHYKCEIIGEIGACNGNISIYCLDYKGEKIAFYLTGIGSAVASSMCYESHHVIGATKYIMFGSCGSLDKETTRGKFIIPTESYLLTLLTFPYFQGFPPLKILYMYPFPLFLPLWDNYKGKFIIQLFNRCLPLYQKVLRKSALLPL